MLKAICLSGFVLLAAEAVMAQASCNQNELSTAYNQGRTEAINQVRQDARAEGRVEGFGLGYDDQDCLQQARRNAYNQQSRAIDQCVQQTAVFRTCEIQNERVLRHPQRLQPVYAVGRVDERNIDQNRCQIDAQNRAIREAINQCQSRYNVGCRISAGPSPATHVIERRRRYGVAGPKEDYHVCESRAEALPDSRNQIECSVELTARVRF